MNILLILPPNIGRYVVATIPHAGIAYLAAFLEREGHSVDIADMRIDPSDENLFAQIERFKPQLIGLSTASIGYKMSYELVSKLKKNFPQIPIAIGGSHVSTVHTKALEETEADYGVYGEGEKTFIELARNEPAENIKGLIWRKKGSIVMNPPAPLAQDLDDFPYPAYQKFQLNKFLEKRIPLVTSRGCPNRCTFCSIQLVMGYPFRTRSPKNVVDEMEHWHKKGYDTFEISDDNFTFNLPRAEKICDLIIERGLKIKMIFGNGLRADRVNEQLLAKLKQAGCVWIAYGLETSDILGLQLLKKDLSVDKLKSAVEMTKKLGIEVQVNFIIGCPGQTFEKFKRDLEFADELGVDQVRFYNLIPYPGTEMFEWVQQNGRFLYPSEKYLNDFNYWSEEPVFETDEFPRTERILAYKMGQSKIMELFLKRHFGKKLGTVGHRLWRQEFVQKHLRGIATKAWVGMKRLKIKQY
ncbi:cobalamin B12-binding domain-containing protein [Candidatus Woesearchaeota archaeon]|nr:cobalamin B12-binding domain-containing protein [Candidatus Woesearchaeota archaeon]